MKRIRNIISYLTLFLLNGVMLWFFRGYLNLLLAVAMIVALVYAMISVHIAKRFLSLELEMPAEELPKNTEFVLKVKMTNRSFIPLMSGEIVLYTGNTFLGETQENHLTVPFRMHGSVEISYPMTSSYVGKIEVCAKAIRVKDLLGFHTVTKPVNLSEHIYMMPLGSDSETFHLNDYEKGMDEAEESQLAGSDFSDVSQVREYVPGDAMKNIHWKLSAKRENLMVKERLHMSSRKLLVVFSLAAKEPQTADETIEKLYSFGRFFLQNRIPITLFWWSRRYRETYSETAESVEEWQQLMIRLFDTQAGDGFVEEHFKAMNPGKGYVYFGETKKESR